MSQQDNTQKDNDLASKIAQAQQEDEDRKEEATTQDQDEVSQLKEDLEKMTEMARRSMADLQNLRRRQEEERAQMIIRANLNLLKEFIPALDNLHRALDHIPQGAEEWAKGISMSIQQIQKVLENAGLKIIETKYQKFNPDLHEALLQGPGEKDLILEELERGYQLGDYVIRHSKVKVGDGS